MSLVEDKNLAECTQAACVDVMNKALRMKTRASFTGSVLDGKNPRFLAINHEIVPCVPENLRRPGKPMCVAFTIIRPLSAGFTSVPYKQGTKPEGGAKKLSEIVVERGEMGTRQQAMQMWSFKKLSNNKDKGARCDDMTWRLQAGNTIMLWLREEDMLKYAMERKAGKVSKYTEPIVPENMVQIDAFTLCEISVKSKNEEQAQNGRGISISSVKPATFSLYSCMTELGSFPQGPQLSVERELVFAERFPCIAGELNAKDAPFWVLVSRTAVLDDSDAAGMELVHLHAPSDDQSIPLVDVQVETLLKYTNMTRVDWACAMLDIAIACGALSLLVFNSDFRAKNGECPLRAVPLVNVETLLAALTMSAGCVAPHVHGADKRLYAVFENIGHTVMVEGVEYNIEVLFSVMPEAVGTGPVPFCSDLAISGLETEIGVGHSIVFNLKAKDGVSGTIQSVWRGYFNASPSNHVLGSSAASSGSKRRRFQPMDTIDRVAHPA